MTLGRDRVAPFGALLRRAFETSNAAAERPIALYLVRLTDSAGLRLAKEVHRVSGGVDPEALRDRALAKGLSMPMMVKAAPVLSLVQTLEGLADLGERDRCWSAWLVQELHRSGEVPIVMLLDGVLTVTSLSAVTEPAASPAGCARMG